MPKRKDKDQPAETPQPDPAEDKRSNTEKVRAELALVLAGTESAPPPPPPPPGFEDRERDRDELIRQLRQLRQRAETTTADIMPELMALGQDVSRGIDVRRYIIGEILVLMVDRKYGAADVSKLADEAGIGLSTARQYEDVVRFFNFENCLTLMDYPNVSYSHLRVAKMAGDLDTALFLLAKVAEYTLSTRELHAVIYGDENTPEEIDDEPKPKEVKVFDLDRAEIRSVNLDDGEITVFVGFGPAAEALKFRTMHLIAKVDAPPKPIKTPPIPAPSPAPAEPISVETPERRYRPVDEDGAIIENAIIEYEGDPA